MKRILSVNHLSKNIDAVLLIARVGIAGLMLTHGLPKIAMLGENSVQFINFLGMGHQASLVLAVFAEVGCSLLLLVGLGTRVAVIPLIVTMLVAVFVAHGGDPFAKQEMGLHYLLVYIMLFVGGSGKYSMDGLVAGKIKRKAAGSPATVITH